MIYTTLLNLAIFQGIVLAFIILKSSLFNNNSNRYLAYLIFTLSIILLNHVFELENAFIPYPFLSFIAHVEWVFLLPAFLFQFVINRTKDAVKHKQKIYLCFIPFAYSALLSIIYDLDRIAGIYTIPESSLYILDLLGLIQLIFAVTFIPFLLFYSFSMMRYLKDSQEKKWMVSFLILVSSLIFAWLIICLIGLFFQYDISSTMNILALTGTLIIHWTAYIGIYKYRLAKDKDAIYNFFNEDSAPSYSNSQLVDIDNVQEDNRESITADNLYFQKLEFLCKEEHMYTDNTLNREKVAEKLGISPGYVSQIVNTVTGDNFVNYINQYRVEAVKQMISNSEYENYNLLTIGLESGFTSKTTFYKAFKKITGQTPNEYKTLVNKSRFIEL